MGNDYDSEGVFECLCNATIFLASGNANLKERLKTVAIGHLYPLILDRFPDDIKGKVKSNIWDILFPGGIEIEKNIDSLDDETCKKVAEAIVRITCEIAIAREKSWGQESDKN
ncbi:MAG: hypothetical protein OXU76_01605 [Alphaproteobacteria bacterium]|nr:hypothetical protein [Alphaproteobacteria bacterium]